MAKAVATEPALDSKIPSGDMAEKWTKYKRTNSLKSAYISIKSLKTLSVTVAWKQAFAVSSTVVMTIKLWVKKISNRTVNNS